MSDKYVMRYVCILLLTLAYLGNMRAQSSYGDFPYYQSFRTSTKPAEIEMAIPQGNKPNAAKFTQDGLQLTTTTTQQFGAVFVKDRQFKSMQGIRVEFEYAMYGGGAAGADGMCVFLFDASVQNPTIGAAGCGIGYSYNRANTTYQSIRATGLSGAYLGVAFDSFGNFKQRRWQGEARVNGIDVSGSTSTRYISNVTLRGARGGETQNNQFSSIVGMSDGYNGYPVLISQPTSGGNWGWILDESTGAHNTLFSEGSYFSLRGENRSAYRKAIIELFPFSESNGFWVTVKIQHGEETTTVIEDYPYRESVLYAENAYNTLGDNITSTGTALNTTTTLNAQVPKLLRIGFAASTGDQTDIHLLKELRITLPSSAEAYNDSISTMKGTPVIIDVLANDKGYSGPIIKNQLGDREFLDPYTFRFCNDTRAFLGTVDTSGTSYITEDGTWRFDFETEKLTFTPVSSLKETATIRYSIKAGIDDESPYNDEAYRSLPAVVKVGIIPPKAVISNRMVTPVITPRLSN